jgi:lipopolysaccharide/colanic/teichoic acid biosynthesis glycosyltransferase
MYITFIKPVFDFTITFILVLILLPVIIIIGFLVYLKLGNPVLFSQLRPGKDAKLFRLYKFRTMNELRDSNDELLTDAKRITNFGKFLRRTSLDELPQFLNVLKGNLSLVGPRPLLVEYLTLYNEEQRKRHLVKPGITGWAQVNGRNSLIWEDKFRLDIFYVEHLSFILDIKILFMTFSKVFKGSDINTDIGMTMDKFKGSKQ